MEFHQKIQANKKFILIRNIEKKQESTIIE